MIMAGISSFLLNETIRNCHDGRKYVLTEARITSEFSRAIRLLHVQLLTYDGNYVKCTAHQCISGCGELSRTYYRIARSMVQVSECFYRNADVCLPERAVINKISII